MPARIDLIAGIALACLLPCMALAQAPQWPMPQDVDRALKANPFPDPGRIASQPVPRPPQIDAQPGGIDIEALAKGKVVVPGSTAAPTSAPLRIFVTLDMPRASLKLLTDQAARSGAVLVLRGLKSQSMRETINAVGELIGESKATWVIDPEAFTRHTVRQAPTFVLAFNDAANVAPGTCGAGCVAPTGFVSVAGDVSLDYALEAIMRRKPEAAPRASPILKRLRAPK